MKRLTVIALLLIAGNAWGFDGSRWDYWHFDHIKTAALCYSGSSDSGVSFASRHFDVICVDPGGNRLTYARTNDTTKVLRYFTTSTYISSADSSTADSFATANGFNDSLMFMWVDENPVRIDTMANPFGVCDTDTGFPTASGGILHSCGYSHYRSQPDWRYEGVWAWARWKACKIALQDYAPSFVFDGLFEDEMLLYTEGPWVPMALVAYPFKDSKWMSGSWTDVTGWDGMTHQQVIDSLIKSKMSWYATHLDTLNGLGLRQFPNPAAYGAKTSDALKYCVEIGADVWNGEGFFLYATYPSATYESKMWSAMDTVSVRDSSGYMVVWIEFQTADSSMGDGWDRAQMQRLAYYYMASSPRTLLQTSREASGNDINSIETADTPVVWWNAIAYDIGDPDGARSIEASGTDGAGQAYTIYRRDFTSTDPAREVTMLYRRRNGSTYDATSAVTVDLGGSYQQLNADSSLGSAVTSVDVRNCEGIIMVQTSGESSAQSRKMRNDVRVTKGTIR